MNIIIIIVRHNCVIVLYHKYVNFYNIIKLLIDMQSPIKIPKRSTISYTVTFLILSTVLVWFCAFKLPNYNFFGPDPFIANTRM
jgi:hypothetical protein